MQQRAGLLGDFAAIGQRSDVMIKRVWHQTGCSDAKRTDYGKKMNVGDTGIVSFYMPDNGSVLKTTITDVFDLSDTQIIYYSYI